MQIGVIGLNHKHASVELREALARVCRRRFTLALPPSPFVVLNTCNRTEIYFSSYDLAETQSTLLSILKAELPFEIGQELYSFFGQDCFYHLAKVTSGFDSAILAETEIQGQVKSSYQQAHQFATLPFELHYLFQKALKIGKDIRHHFIFPRLDIEHAVLHLGEHLINPTILFVGASRTNVKIAQFLKKKEYGNICFANRTDETAQRLCALEGFRFLEWSKKSYWVRFDWVIVATKADHYQLFQKDLQGELRTKLCIDLSVPRNIEQGIGEFLPLVNIDQVNEVLQKYSSLIEEKRQEVEHLLEEGAQKYISLFHDRSEKLYVFA